MVKSQFCDMVIILANYVSIIANKCLSPYTHLKRWLRGKGMPTFYNDANWKGYSVYARNHSFLREILRFYSFNISTELLPYFYSTTLCFDLQLRRHIYNREKELNYEYRLLESIEDKTIDKYNGGGIFKITKAATIFMQTWNYKAINLKRISKTGKQFRLQIKLSDGIDSSDFMDLAEWTIRDKDDFGVGLLWILVSAIIGAIIGAIVGSKI